jgi:DNA uptake protein ComE-like DNA-binding protein
LNDNLGGTGGDWRNLTPLTQATNNRSAVSMLHTFENKVKSAVAGGDTVEFFVNMSFGRPDRSTDAAIAKNQTPVEEGKKIADIILAEQFVPTSVQGTAKKIDAGGKVTNLVSSTTTNSIDTNLDHYTTNVSLRKTVNINKASKADLLALNGVDGKMAENIKSLRPLKDRDDMRNKLKNDQLWHSIVSTSGIRIRFKQS